ncbi:MAG: RNA polymerase sigma factor [Pseudomonadota bacterium]
MMQHSVLMQTYLDCKNDLLQFLSRRTGSQSLAADLVHDLYLKLSHMSENRSVDNNRGYLFSMAANLATDHERVENRRRQLLQQASGSVWLEADELSPERHMIADAELAFLADEVAKLEPRCRKVFYLNRYENQSQAEIAAQLGIGLTTVFKDLKVAMTALMKARRRFHASEASHCE